MFLLLNQHKSTTIPHLYRKRKDDRNHDIEKKIARFENQLSELSDVEQAHMILKTEPKDDTDVADNVFTDNEEEDHDASDLSRSPPPAAAEPKIDWLHILLLSV